MTTVVQMLPGKPPAIDHQHTHVVQIYLIADPSDELDRIVMVGMLTSVKEYVRVQRLDCIASITYDFGHHALEITCSDAPYTLRALASLLVRYDFFRCSSERHHGPFAKLLPAKFSLTHDDGIVIDMRHYLFNAVEDGVEHEKTRRYEENFFSP